jgi:hypothetical protein
VEPLTLEQLHELAADPASPVARFAEEARAALKPEIVGMNRKISKLESELAALGPARDHARRLDRIERAYQAKNDRLALDYEARTAAHEAGIPYELIGAVADRRELAERLEAVSRALDTHAAKEINGLITSTAYRPGSGNEAPAPLTRRDLDRMAPDQVVAAHRRGKLARIFAGGR